MASWGHVLEERCARSWPTYTTEMYCKVAVLIVFKNRDGSGEERLEKTMIRLLEVCHL